jgi:hypothetical protein
MSKKHIPSITHRSAGCSCRNWMIEQRREGETQGSFTTRAYSAFLAHCATPERGLFDLSEPAPEPIGLFQ